MSRSAGRTASDARASVSAITAGYEALRSHHLPLDPAVPNCHPAFMLRCGIMVLAVAAMVAAGCRFLTNRGVGDAGINNTTAIMPRGRPSAAVGQHRILLVGTSLTARGNWAAPLARALAVRNCPDVAVEVLARPGANSAWGEAALAARLANGTSLPGTVVIEFTGNDASLIRGLSLTASDISHRRMIEMVQRSGAVAVLLVISPSFGRKRLERPGFDGYRRLYRDIATAADAGFIDTTAGFRSSAASRRRALIPDGLHPTPAALTQLMVPALAAFLEPLACSGNHHAATRHAAA